MPQSPKFYFFIGTEAELIKFFPVLAEFLRRKVSFKIIASGQNNIQKSQLLKILQIKNADIILHTEPIHQSVFGLLLWFIKNFFSGILQLRSELGGKKSSQMVMIVHGDTVSTVLGSLIGVIYGCKIAHLEAGLRSFNYLSPFPEEIDRVLVSQIARIHFCPNQWAIDNIKNLRGVKINTYQNTLLESLKLAVKYKIDLPLFHKIGKQKYFVFVCHRQENLLNRRLLNFLIDEAILTSKRMKCVFILHELTKVSLENAGLLAKIQSNKNIITTPRLTYIEMMHLLDKCEFLITDGGSNQEEAYYLGKPCLLLRESTERIEGLQENALLSKNDQSVIHEFVENYQKYRRPAVKPKVSPTKIIVDYLVKGVYGSY